MMCVLRVGKNVFSELEGHYLCVYIFSTCKPSCGILLKAPSSMGSTLSVDVHPATMRDPEALYISLFQVNSSWAHLLVTNFTCFLFKETKSHSSAAAGQESLNCYRFFKFPARGFRVVSIWEFHFLTSATCGKADKESQRLAGTPVIICFYFN